jgi:hypothetical protein
MKILIDPAGWPVLAVGRGEAALDGAAVGEADATPTDPELDVNGDDDGAAAGVAAHAARRHAASTTAARRKETSTSSLIRATVLPPWSMADASRWYDAERRSSVKGHEAPRI